MDESVIERSLNIFGFALENIDIKKIQHVPMHEWRVSSIKKPQLYIENLQCCIALYSYGNGFGFASHINTVVFDKDEFILDENNKPILCQRCIDLYNQILKYSGTIVEPFKIGISLGETPLDDGEESMIAIYGSLDQTISKLNDLGIPIILLERIYEPEFIVDVENSCILTPIKTNKFK